MGETDLDVDICSDSNDESSGLDISDTTLHKQIIDWRTKQRKLRSERRIKLRIVRQNETADQRKVRITWRIRRRTKRRKLRLSRKGWSFLQWQKRNTRRIRRRKGLAKDDEITDYSSSSGDSDYSGSDLETDFDVDICSNSNDESSGLDVTDPSLKKEIKDWRILKRKTRSERRIKLRIVRISESAEV